jgi:hypothetical protein
VTVSEAVTQLLMLPQAMLARAVPLANARQVSTDSAKALRKSLLDVWFFDDVFIAVRYFFFVCLFVC